MALLRPGRCRSRRQGGCLQHRRETQRRPKGQHAGGTPALPGDALPAGDFSESRPAPLGKLPFARRPRPCPEPRGSFESETTDHGGLSGGRTLWGEVGRRPNILFIPSIHVDQGLTHARGRDRTPRTSTRDLGVKWCPSWMSFVDCPSRVPKRGPDCRSQPAAIQKYQSRPTRALTPLASSDKGTVTPTSANGMVLAALP